MARVSTDGNHVHIEIRQSPASPGSIDAGTHKVDLPRAISGRQIFLRGYAIKGAPVTAGVPDHPTYTLDFPHHNGPVFTAWTPATSYGPDVVTQPPLSAATGVPLLLKSDYTAKWISPPLHIQHTLPGHANDQSPIHLERFDILLRDTNNQAATYEWLALYLDVIP